MPIIRQRLTITCSHCDKVMLDLPEVVTGNSLLVPGFWITRSVGQNATITVSSSALITTSIPGIPDPTPCCSKPCLDAQVGAALVLSKLGGTLA